MHEFPNKEKQKAWVSTREFLTTFRRKSEADTFFNFRIDNLTETERVNLKKKIYLYFANT